MLKSYIEGLSYVCSEGLKNSNNQINNIHRFLIAFRIDKEVNQRS